MADNFVFNPGEEDLNFRPPAPAGLVSRFFMNLTGAKSAATTNRIMLGVAIVFILLAVVVLVYSF